MGTETVMRSMDAELVTRLDDISEDREAYRVQPGWWLRTIRDDDTREWVYIVMWMHGQQVTTGRKTVHLIGISPDEPDVCHEMAAYREQAVCCITKAQANKLGLGDPRKTKED